MEIFSSCPALFFRLRACLSGLPGRINSRQSLPLRSCQIAGGLLLASLPSFADEIVVADTSDATLRNAIASANPGDVITFDSALSGQTIALTGGALTISVNLTIDASGLSEGLSISGGGVSRVFNINGGVGVVFKGFEILNGFSGESQDGGGSTSTRAA
jgi:hypothetical protein